MSRRTKILIIIAGVMALLVAYLYWPSSSTETAPEDEPEFSVLTPEEQSMLEEVRKIKNLSFDIGLFEDPIFKSLQDIELPSAPTEPTGRPNPFLPY